MEEAQDRRTQARATIVGVAARLLREHGPAAVTTRGVAEEAGVQAPAIYRLFGDKDGLLDAVAEHVMAEFVATKQVVAQAASAADVDPLEDLRTAWTAQIEFGLANPSLFRLLSDPERGRRSPAAQAGLGVLAARVHRVAAAGRLRVGEQRAVDLIQAAGTGAIQTLLLSSPEERDAGLATSMYDAVMREILTDPPAEHSPGPLAPTVAFRAVAADLTMLSEAEHLLLAEWLDRAVDGLQARRGSG